MQTNGEQMEIRDYLRMLRRGWPVILLFTVLGLGLASSYLAIAPKRYEANAVLFVSTTAPQSTNDLTLGLQYSISAAPTYADIVDSPEVLGPVSDQLTPHRSVAELEQMVTVNARESTALIDVTAAADSATEAARISNTVATVAEKTVPALLPQARTDRIGTRLETIGAASQPSSAVSPNTKHVIAIGFIVGVAAGLAFTIAQQALDTRLRRPEDLQQVAKLPLIAVLPRQKRSQRSHVVVRDDPASRVVEAYRSLRTNLVYLEQSERRSLLFTGVGHRGDPTVPVNLAWSMAQAGRRVLLVDLDLRQSTLADLLRVGSSSGMSDVLAGKVELSDAIHDTSQKNLHVVVSGTTQPSPSDLLSNPATERMLRRAEKDFDYVILHAPPLLAYTDAAVVSRVAGQTIVTVRSGRARAIDLTTALGAPGNVRVDPLGLVLTDARAHVGDMNKVRGIWTRPRIVPRVQWDDSPADMREGWHRS